MFSYTYQKNKEIAQFIFLCNKDYLFCYVNGEHLSGPQYPGHNFGTTMRSFFRGNPTKKVGITGKTLNKTVLDGRDYILCKIGMKVSYITSTSCSYST